MKSISFLSILLVFCSCTSKNKPEATTPPQDSVGVGVLDGEYELYYGAVDGGYLYYKLMLQQKGNDFTGSFFSGIYLSKNDQGYTMPAATVTSALTGQLEGKNEAILYLGTPTDTSRMDKTYSFPEPEKIFDSDANADPVDKHKENWKRLSMGTQWRHVAVHQGGSA